VTSQVASVAPGLAPRWQLVIDVVGAALFGAILIPFVSSASQPSGAIVVGLLVLALAVRRQLIYLMIALAVMAAFVQVVTVQILYPADLAYPVLFFVLGSHPRRDIRILGLVCALIAPVVAGLFAAVQIRTSDSIDPVLSTSMIFVALTALFTVGGWVAGYIRWVSRQALQARVHARLAAVERQRLRDLVDQEQLRSRIATDMHDVVAHSWAVVAAQAAGARYRVHENPAQAERALEVIGETARSAIADLRTILARLRDQDLVDTAPDWQQQELLFTRMRESGMQIDYEQTGVPTSSPLFAMSAYRVLSESLTNALKHADLSEPVTVRQSWHPGYRLRVVNAVSDRQPPPGTGHGIIGMRERVTVDGGSLSSRREGDRWVLEAYLPDPVDLTESQS
jgi:signal transduction histidine kinase